MEEKKLTSEEIKAVLAVTNNYKQFVKLQQLTMGSPTRALILKAISKYGELTKMEISKILHKTGVSISYKNVSENIDKLEKAKMLKYIKGKRQYNTVIVKAGPCFGTTQDTKILDSKKIFSFSS